MNETSPESVWNSLEVVKLLVSAITPILVIIVGFWLNRQLKRIEQLQWANQKIIEKRIEVFDKLAPSLNDLLAFFTYVGRWNELTPPQIINHKRELDRTFFIYAPLFSEEFRKAYDRFINVCYLPYQGWGHAAKLRTLTHRRKEAAGPSWIPEWDGHFAEGADVTDPGEIRDAYENLMSVFAAELGIGLKPLAISTGPIPGNIR